MVLPGPLLGRLEWVSDRMADKQNWAAVAERLGLVASGGLRKPRTLDGQMDGITVRVSYRPPGERTRDSTSFYAVLPRGPYDSYRFLVKSSVRFKLQPSRYVDTGDPEFDRLFSVKTGKNAADYAIGFLNAKRRAALIQAGSGVRLMCNPSMATRGWGAPEEASLLHSMVRGRASGPLITETLNLLVATAKSLSD